MATQQGWFDFQSLTGPLEFIDGLIGGTLKGVFQRLETDYLAIVADPARTAEAAAIADTHYKWTAVVVLDKITRYLALRDYLVAQGFIT